MRFWIMLLSVAALLAFAGCEADIDTDALSHPSPQGEEIVTVTPERAR
jgi:hypothetical protein